MNPALERYEQIIEDLHGSLQAANAPAELLHVIGLLNGVLRIYERTDQAGIDFTDPEAPLVALPKQVEFLEEKLNKLFARVGTSRVKFSAE